MIDQGMWINCPEELNPPNSNIDEKIMCLSNSKFDAIIGLNVLLPTRSIINNAAVRLQ